MPLPREADPVVEARLRIIETSRRRRGFAHVPFAHKRRVVAGNL